MYIHIQYYHTTGRMYVLSTTVLVHVVYTLHVVRSRRGVLRYLVAAAVLCDLYYIHMV